MVGLPPCFIGSSAEGEPYAEALRVHLEDAGVPARLWSLETFAAGKTTLETLEEQLDQCSFAVLVVTPDDELSKRGSFKLAPRDNVMLEYGMFLGRLGRERTFLLAPRGLKELHLPSDLLGMTLKLYTHRDDATLAQRRTAMKARADEIIEEIRRLEWLDPPLDATLVGDLLGGVSRHLDSSRTMLPGRADAWVQAVLNTVQERFVSRTEDAYSAWLRPGADDRLRVGRHSNLPRDYPNEEGWARDEGLVGRVWVQGQAASVSALRGHPWYEPREGCENESYIAAPVGAPGGPGGVLAVGSDNGFVLQPGDRDFVVVYAAVLALALSAENAPAPHDTIGAAVGDALRVPGRLTGAALRALRG